MSEREYAAHAGISRGAVQKAKISGRLVVHDDGTIDAAASDARRAATTDPTKQHGPRAGQQGVPATATAAVRSTLREQGLPAGAMTFVQARTANEVLKAQERRLRVQREKGELVDRARTVALVYRLARQERDAWLAWPARVAALMAADLGTEPHALQSLLESHVRRHLAELAEFRVDLR